MKKPQFYVTIDYRLKIIWGTGNTVKKSHKEALENAKYYVKSWRFFGKQKGDEERENDLLKIKLKTYKISEEDYEWTNLHGTSERTKFRINNGILKIIKYQT